jgi:hypothetical protein
MKMNTIQWIKWMKAALLLTLMLGFHSAQAKENIGLKKSGSKPVLRKYGAGCAAATQQKDLDLNNVRTTILNGGDMWWNLQNARYEVPRVEPGNTSKHSLFSGALWIGGVTLGNLRIAAQTYRQSGNDYYPGALTVDGSASISADRCKAYDRVWKVTLAEIEEFIANPNSWSTPNSDGIITWPGTGKHDKDPVTQEPTNFVEARFLAPYFDNDSNGVYEPSAGDFPTFDQDVINNIPDMMLYTIYNDKGNIHSESEGLPLGLELHTQSFAYSTSDEINNMTFYRTTIYNRSTETIDSCIFGQWVDADLGNYSDDYVECDVKRNLGICYNGDDNDEGILGYGLNPPSVGVNFFEGPKKIVGNDTIEIGLTKFVYYNNDFSVTGNPSRPEHYWNYLNGRWKDGLSITYGGNGRGGTDTASFMFPGSSDPAGRVDWTERIAGNTPQDRRFLQCSGPFQLLPGSKNEVTVAVVWARATTGGATGSFNLLKEASDKAFVLYKNNFKILNGPATPEMEIVENDRELILTIPNYGVTENYTDSSAGLCSDFTRYKFQGYQIFQLTKSSIPSDLYNQEEAKLIAQCDVQDGIALLVNVVNDEVLGSVKKIMVNGEDKGVKHSFRITRDAFSKESDPTLVNFQNYYYVLVTYAAAQNCPTDALQYLAGRRMVDGSAIKIYNVVPHKPTPRGQGTELNTMYGDGPEITKISGIGNDANVLQLTKESIEKALIAPYYVPQATYARGAGPVKVKVINPFKVPMSDFQLRFVDTSSSTVKADSLTSRSSYWTLTDLTNNKVYASERALNSPNEQVFGELGLSISISQVVGPGQPDNQTDLDNGFVSSSITFENTTNRWLTGVSDEAAGLVPFNWIRAGNTGTPGFANAYEHDFAAGGRPVDPRRQYNKVIDGTWAPYSLAARAVLPQPTFGPAWAPGNQGGYSSDNPLSDLQSVQVVITNDKSKWSRAIVLEAGENPATTIGGAAKLNRRRSASLGKDAKPDGNGIGKGWFPGYAINKETGERLNIMFAEDSSLPLDNGGDMIWNPTSTLIRPSPAGLDYIFGGKHHIYVMGAKNFKISANSTYRGPRYDECKSYDSLFNLIENGTSAIINKRCIFSQALWVSIPLTDPRVQLGNLNDVGAGIPTKVTIDINVKRPYAQKYSFDPATNDTAGFPLYNFSTKNLAPEVGTAAAGKTALDMVSISPNPYYAYAGYEDPTNQLDTRARITNLPTKCVVSIYTQGGFLVRRIRKDDDSRTFIDWDLKNDANVPIASGVYLIHIYADGIGERVIKWFGVMRPADFDTF